MTWPALVFDVLIASPSDVRQERDAVERVILRWNAANAVSGAMLRPRRWERDAIPAMGDRPQGLINQQFVDNCDIGIGIFWSKLGTPTGDATSGTVEEIRRLRARGRRLLVYFSNRPPPPDAAADTLAALADFKDQCRNDGLYAPYDDYADLSVQVFHHLTVAVRELMQGISPQVPVKATVAMNVEALTTAEQGHPEFDVALSSLNRSTARFSPEFRISQISGKHVPVFEWRLHAFGELKEWRQVHSGELERTHFTAEFDLTPHLPVAVGQVALQLRYPWKGRWRHERHRWPATRLTSVGKTVWDMGDETIPPQYWESDSPDDVAPEESADG